MTHTAGDVIMEKSSYYLAGKLLAVGVTAVRLFEEVDTGALIIRVLVLCCLFMLQLLLGMRKTRKASYRTAVHICQAGAFVLLFVTGLEQYLLVAVAAGLEMLDDLVGGMLYYEIGAVCLALLWFLYPPEQSMILLVTVFVGCFLLLRHAEGRRAFLWNANLDQKEKISALQEKLSAMQTYTRTIQEVTAAEERSRFAARIHDKLGHSISGSIILLEAAALTVETDPQGAKRSMEKVADNLREGVDDIRAALRQERPGLDRLGLQELKRILEEFQVTYGRQAHLEVSGSTEVIPAPTWICIQENLKEALTNMLKHSSGDRFTMRIQVLQSAVRVEYADNGSCEEPRPGMGLQAIEERTAGCGGRCVFNGGQNGFRIILVFGRGAGLAAVKAAE